MKCIFPDLDYITKHPLIFGERDYGYIYAVTILKLSQVYRNKLGFYSSFNYINSVKKLALRAMHIRVWFLYNLFIFILKGLVLFRASSFYVQKLCSVILLLAHCITFSISEVVQLNI